MFMLHPSNAFICLPSVAGSSDAAVLALGSLEKLRRRHTADRRLHSIHTRPSQHFDNEPRCNCSWQGNLCLSQLECPPDSCARFRLRTTTYPGWRTGIERKPLSSIFELLGGLMFHKLTARGWHGGRASTSSLGEGYSSQWLWLAAERNISRNENDARTKKNVGNKPLLGVLVGE